MLGLNYINREELSEGMGCLGKAYDLYESFKETKVPNVYHNRSYDAKGRSFKCYYEGGIDHEQM